MTRNSETQVYSPQELADSLRRLGIQELQERLEFTPLLVDSGLNPGEETTSMPCCVCKIADPSQLDDNGMLPYPHMDPSGLS